MNNKLIVVATHPDDETLGAGGSLLKFKSEGWDIFWLILTHVHTEYGFTPERVESRNHEIAKVASQYAFTDYFMLNYPTMHLDEIPKGKIISEISGIFSSVKPTHVILPFYGDVHTDHRVGFECAYACTKAFRYPSIKNIWMMETPSETDFGLPGQQNVFSPNLFVDITDKMKGKEEIFRIYESESAPHPFPRSIDNLYALATTRGATAGFFYAEAFMSIKTIL